MWRAWLRPSRWAFGILSVFWAWRLGSYALRATYGPTWQPAIAVGFVWDVMLVAALVAGYRAVRSRAAQGGRRAMAANVLSVLLLLGSALSRGADLAYCAMTGGHWDAAGFLYLDPANLKLLRISDGQLLVLAAAVSWGLCIAMLRLDARRVLSVAVDSERRRWTPLLRPALVFTTMLTPLLVGQGATDGAPSRFVPEANFIHQWLLWRGIAGHDVGVTMPASAELERLREGGLAPAEPLHTRYPLLRASIDPTPFPYPGRGEGEGPPNVVFTYVEQLDHLFVHAFSGQMKGLMPEFDALAGRMTKVTEYRSTTNPTIHALLGALCSEYGSESYRKLNAGKGSETLEHTPLSCLPDILRRRGFRTVYIQGADKAFSGKGDFLLAHGFDEVHDLSDIDAVYPRPSPSRWGSHDGPLVSYAQDQIRRLEALRKKDGRPYFLMVMTLDTHHPGFAPRSCTAPTKLYRHGRDKRSKRMLDAIHCSDKEIGRLGRFILDEEARREQTMLMLTGDHPTLPFSFIRIAHHRMKVPYHGWYGRLPMLIHDPRHRLPQSVPVLSGHTDIAPTLLHMLGITDVVNAMTGHSIFGLRPHHPLLLGRMGNRYISVYTPKGVQRLTHKGLVKACDDGTALRVGATALHACDVLSWLLWHNTLWRHKRLLPPPAELRALGWLEDARE